MFWGVAKFTCQRVTLISPVNISKTLDGLWKNKPDNPQIITPTREIGDGSVDKMNTVIHEKLYGATTTPKILPCPEESVIITKNYYSPEGSRLLCSNGDIGEFVEYKKKAVYIKLDRTKEVVKVGKEDMELAHALTVHKTQGSEYDVVILVLVDVPRPLANRELLYTAVTRAKRKLYIISDEATLSLCMRQQISKRKCKLAEYLDACLDTLG